MCQSCHWWHHVVGRIVSAMTTFLVLSAVLLVVELVAGLRTLRRDRPTSPPASHLDWSVGRLPSAPYALRH
jgi:hypothetical protein